MRRSSRVLLLSLIGAAVLIPSAGFAALLPAPGGTQWTLDDGTYAPDLGANTMSLWTVHTNAYPNVYYPSVNSTDWGLSDPPGTPGRTIWVNDPFTKGTQALAVSTGAANGGGAKINQYSIVMDVMLEGGNLDFPILFNADDTNTSFGFFYLDGTPANNGTGMKLAIENSVGGASVNKFEWHRIAYVVDLDAGIAKGFVDGTLAVSGGFALDANRIALIPNSSLLLFADRVGGSTGSWGLANLWFGEGIVLTNSDVAALGGVDGNGIYSVPEPSSSLTFALMGMISLLTYSRKKRKC